MGTMEGEPGDVETEIPKLAPTYIPVEAKGDAPGPRCGHTLTAVTGGGEGGSAASRLILFGGATALESSGGGGGGSAGGAAGIRKIFVVINISML